MLVEPYLKKLVERQGSDLFITAFTPPSIKVHGEIESLGSVTLSPEKSQEIVLDMMNEKQKTEFEKNCEANFAIQSDIGRFRVSAFKQRNWTGAVLRYIKAEIPTFESIHLPAILKDIVLINRGLVILVGATGVGKSTTLAAMISYRNQMTTGHIITVEDPIEYVYENNKSIVTQREVGIDTLSFEEALKNTLRQAPNVILIGEIRTSETMRHAITFAETGHLCLATLHANNANQALERIASFYPESEKQHLWMDLSLNLKAIVAQQLLNRIDNKGRIPAFEILINTPVVSDHIRKGEINVLKDFMGKGNQEGMQTFDQALYRLYAEGLISYDTALRYADSENEVRLMIKLNKGQPEAEAVQKFSLRKDNSEEAR